MKIKALSWRITDGGLHDAETPFGHYQINALPKGSAVYFIAGPEWSAGHIRVNENLLLSLDEAKKLASKDFEARARACFV